jgi:hypothetical protein
LVTPNSLANWAGSRPLLISNCTARLPPAKFGAFYRLELPYKGLRQIKYMNAGVGLMLLVWASFRTVAGYPRLTA